MRHQASCHRCGTPLHRGTRYCSADCYHADRIGKPGRPHSDQRFWKSVKRTNGCWEWQGKIKQGNSLGYGILMWKRKPDQRAHRIAYELAIGPIPDGLSVLHECDNPVCCRPDHLFLGTRKENNADREAKGRTVHGEGCPWAKLTAVQVTEIRQRREQGETGRSIALRFGITDSMVYRIVKREAWKRIP